MPLPTKLLRIQVSLLKPFTSGCSIETIRFAQNRLGDLMTLGNREKVVFTDHDFGSFTGRLIIPKKRTHRGVILYLHGGGYVAGDLEYATGYGTVLATMCETDVFCAVYRLAPESPFPAAVDDAETAYRYLISLGCDAESIILCGESAGGGLVYSLALRIKELGLPMPGGIVALSPWTDLTMSGESYAENAEHDPSMTRDRLVDYAQMYLRGTDARNPIASPLFGDLTNLPPSLIFCGGDEIMLSDSAEIHRRLTEAGCVSSLCVRKGMWHVYPLYGMKESEEDNAAIAKFVSEVLG